jgi:hypothetical protein
MKRVLLREISQHAPFTLVGAVSGIVFMIIFRNIPHETAEIMFYVFHPLHVVLSALVTASMYRLHAAGDRRLWVLVPIGYVGSIGIATLSDSVIPHLGELLLGLPHAHAHLGFIEMWWLVSLSALAGIAIAVWRPSTKFPHSAHVLLSTWASLFHVIMAAGGGLAWHYYLVILLFLFLAVWIPCCFSDIIFPLLFTKEGKAEAEEEDG